ncbi:MAG TPA: sensor histidine kinase [Verrucomicrobiae bacterium]|nr:sensor histidine kinase [Verrucomicrobiae bacterium]
MNDHALPAIAGKVLIWYGFTVVILFFGGFPALSHAQELPGAQSVLTNIAEIRELMPHAAERHLPVHVRAQVTFGNLGRLCFLQDDTGAIFIRRKPDAVYLRPGQLVEMTGVALPGDWAPIVREDSVKIIGESPLPPPKVLTFDEFNAGKADCQWVEVRGIVRIARAIADHLHLEIAVGGGRMRAYDYNCPYKNVPSLVDSTIRIRGAMGGIFNHNGQFAAPLLFASGTNSLTVERAAPSSPFEAPLRPADSLLRYVPGVDYDHRVRIAGIVTYQEPAQMVFVRDGLQGLRIQTSEKILVKPGDRIEAVGFPVMGQYTPALEDAIFRLTASGTPPAPLETTIGDVLSGKMDANLVTLDARLIDFFLRANEYILVLQDSNIIFSAHLPYTESSPVKLEKESRVRIAGICSIRNVHESVSFLTPQSFELLLRSPGDVTILERPSWWTLSRVLWILCAMAVVILIGVAWVVVLNRRVREQTQILHQRVQREAALEERNRIAREFHDTLEQELAGIALQLDTVAVHMKGSPGIAVRQLEMARNLSRHTLVEARRSVWDLRSHLLANNNLATALAEVARQFESAQTKIEVQTSGAPRKLPARVENNLLRITQEALTNTLKHSRAKSVFVRLDYEAQKTRLTIQDDGIGFNLKQVGGIEGGHFGLLGMRERAERSGASFLLQSAPGSGTRIIVESMGTASLSQNNC